MYITQKQIARIKLAVEEIKRLATMETCALKQDIKNVLRESGWLNWFECYAIKIEDTLNLGGQNNENI